MKKMLIPLTYQNRHSINLQMVVSEVKWSFFFQIWNCVESILVLERPHLKFQIQLFKPTKNFCFDMKEMLPLPILMTARTGP